MRDITLMKPALRNWPEENVAFAQWHYSCFGGRFSVSRLFAECARLVRAGPTIVIGRHAYGDQYHATDFVVPGEAS